MKPKPEFREAVMFWLKLGFISFGGPAGQISIMQEYLVERKKWISNSRFMHALNYCMLLPGPEAQQLAIYNGWLLHGTRGGIVAGLLFIIPSILILLGLSVLYVLFGKILWFQSLFEGLKPAVVAIVFFACYRIGRKSLKSGFLVGIALLSFACIFFFNVPFPLIIVSVGLIAMVCVFFFPEKMKQKNQGSLDGTDESLYAINALEEHRKFSWHPGSLALKTACVLALWGIPLLAIQLFAKDAAFWNTLCIFFTKAALVTFGGAYAVLPYVAQVSVEKLHWLNSSQMMDGLALGETTPGPLIMVLAFVGFIGSYGHYGGSLLHGSIGLLTTVYFTFLPCFFFVLAGAPIVERARNFEKINGIISWLSAAVAGVILNLGVYLGRTVLFKDSIGMQHVQVFNLAWILVSLVFLIRFKGNMILWIGISACAGLIRFFLFY
jgi:chromate transporter